MKRNVPKFAYLDHRFGEALREVHSYAAHVDDWVTVKKQLLLTLPSDLRSAFSVRDPITKKQRTNEFERALAGMWSELTGREVIFRDDEDEEPTPS